jgi:hypothetical protein
MITATFRCGHSQRVSPTSAAPPICNLCGERVVSRVSGATPKFMGACSGPCAETRAVEPAVVSLASATMTLKSPKE